MISQCGSSLGTNQSSSCKVNLQLGERVLILDFPEKYSLCNHLTGIMNKPLVTHLLCTTKTWCQVCYNSLFLLLLVTKCNMTPLHFNKISTIKYFLTKSVTFYKKMIPFIKKLIYFIDGCGVQYKNFENFENYKYHCQGFSLKTDWHFFATSHCKTSWHWWQNQKTSYQWRPLKNY